MSLLYLLICIFSDPGVLPKYNNSKITEEDIKSNSFLKKKKYYFIRGRKFKVKLCSTCHIFRGPGFAVCFSKRLPLKSMRHSFWSNSSVRGSNLFTSIGLVVYIGQKQKIKSIKDKFIEIFKNEYYSLIMILLSFGVSNIFLIIIIELLFCDNFIWLSYLFHIKKYDYIC